MRIKAIILIIMLMPLALCAQQEKKEVLIVGTMHNVPSIVKNSYKPLLKRALEYRPEAIYVEYIMPNDFESWSYMKDGWSVGYQEFYKLSDSLRTAIIFDQSEFSRLSRKKVESLSSGEVSLLVELYAYQRDYANYAFFRYVQQYGVGGSKKSFGNENTDLSFKLALQLGINKLYGIDDQHTVKLYQQTLSDCMKYGESNGDTDILKKLDKKDTRASIAPALIGRLGWHINTPESLNRKHTIHSARYVTQENSACSNCTEYWDERNARIAGNLLQQLNQTDYGKVIVIIGAGHVVGLKHELEKQSPNVRVRLLYEE